MTPRVHTTPAANHSEPIARDDLTRISLAAELTWVEAGSRRASTLITDLRPAAGTASPGRRATAGGFEVAVTTTTDPDVAVTPDDPGCQTIGLTLTRSADAAPVRLIDLTWTVSGVPAELDRVWYTTFNCWGTPGIVDRAVLHEEPPNPPAWRTAFLSADSRDGISFAYRFPARWVHLTRARPDGAVTLTTQIDADLAPGETWRDDTLAIVAGDVTEGLAGPPSFHLSRRPRADIASHGAWNSWDYYRLNVTADDVRENLDAIRSNDALRRFVKYVVVDDGWETMAGDWEANEKFPVGIEAIAREIRSAGFVPGVWTAPFVVNRRSRVFEEHPDWFVQHDGAPFSMFAAAGAKGVWGERYFLDPSHPGTKEHVRRLYEKLRGWGIGYFKTDFLTNSYSAAICGPLPDRGERLRYQDHSAGILGHHRECMEIMREAMGPQSFWLGCGSIWATGAGLMDGSRTTGDIAPHWFDLVKCAATAFFNGHQHGRVFLNDPDFLVVRGPETVAPGTLDLTDEELAAKAPNTHRSGPFFTADEARMWASLVLLSGGIVTFSDRMGALNEVGIDIVEKTCGLAARSNGEPAFPLDVTQELPTAALRMGDAHDLLGLFNWTDGANRPLTRPLPSSYRDAEWRDVWSGERYRTGALAKLELSGHRCLLLERV